MSATYYGPMRLPEAPVRLTEHPKVEPLPGPDDPEPRRGRQWVCSSLRVGGKTVHRAQDLTPNRIAYSLATDVKDAYCLERKAQLHGAWILDVCGSSWGRNCPFRDESQEAA